jgi:hypothetical protein
LLFAAGRCRLRPDGVRHGWQSQLRRPPLAGAFANIEVGGLLPGIQFDIRSDSRHLTIVALSDGVAIPEPATIIVLLGCILCLRCQRLARGKAVETGCAKNIPAVRWLAVALPDFSISICQRR